MLTTLYTAARRQISRRLPALLAPLIAATLSISFVAVAAARARHRQHQQALVGPLSQSHVKLTKVTLQGGKGGGGDPGDDYPAVWRDAPQDSLLDNWKEYNRECTSWVAWALYSRNGFNMPFHANANEWGPDATRLGYTVNSVPAPGSVAWSNAGTYGHVAYVVSVSGPNIYIEEYNEHYNGTYDSRTVAASAFTGFIHFKDQPAAPPPASAPAPAPAPTTTVSTVTSVTTSDLTSVITATSTSTLPGGQVTTATSTSTTTVPVTSTTTSTSVVTQPPPPTYSETPGSVVHTWTDYSNAGGNQGPSIPSSQTVQIACKVTGFAVADGDTWWYRIASSPWNGSYYGSADAFYNNGQTSGSLHGTPFVDPNVPNC